MTVTIFIKTQIIFSYTKPLEISCVCIGSTASLLVACQNEFYFCLHQDKNNPKHIFCVTGGGGGCTMEIYKNVNIKDINTASGSSHTNVFIS